MKVYHFEVEGNREMTEISDHGKLEFVERGKL
jgi:hypothetical protein